MKEKPRGKPIKVTNDELIVDDAAEDMLSVFVRGCTGIITIDTPIGGKQRFRRNKTNNRIRKIKDK